MIKRAALLFLGLTFISMMLSGCWIEAVNKPGPAPGTDSTTVFKDVSESHLPTDSLSHNSMAAKAVDLDQDGDLDLVIAVEFHSNKILINNGSGHFTDESANRMSSYNFDSQDLAIADFNADGSPDLFFANGSGQPNSYYLNNGDGYFSNVTSRIPAISTTSHAVAAADINGDGAADLIIGNHQRNTILINNGQGYFSDQSTTRLPNINSSTRDLTLGDVNRDSYPDLLTANEDDNRVQLNTRKGYFVDRTQTMLPLINEIEETHDINLADINNDGYPDLYFANALLLQSGQTAQDRLLINRQEQFVDVTANQLPMQNFNTLDADFFDVDGDGDVDLITGNFGSLNENTGNYSGNNYANVLINNGAGSFSYAKTRYLPVNFSPKVEDFEIADYNDDGLLDIYVANFNSPDVLLLRRKK